MFREKIAMLLAEDGAEQCITRFYIFAKESKQHAASVIMTFDLCVIYTYITLCSAEHVMYYCMEKYSFAKRRNKSITYMCGSEKG